MGLKTKVFICSAIILFLGFFASSKVNAATLANVSDSVTTSRPSASSPLNSDQAASAVLVSIIDNGSIFLASDSAILQSDIGQTLNTVNIASMSAQISGTPNTRNVYFTSTAANTHHKGTALVTNITATHIIKFTTNSSVPNGGKIIINFPGSGSNIASASATTFSFNNLGNSAVICNPTTACSGGKSISAPTITLTTGAAISGSTTVFIAIGCTGTVDTSGICSTYAPALINPTASVNQCVGATCTANTWKVSIQTTDSSDIVLDSSSAKIGTIQAVQVQGTVEPSLTFTITGLANATNITTQNASCTGGDITNPGSGLDATATFVNLGSLSNGIINISAQELTVSTNGAAGYSITATSSGRFLNPTSGFFITDANGGNGLTAVDTPVPAIFPATGNPAFGIHPCGADVNTSTWTNAATGFASGAKYSNPWNSGVNGFYANIASYSSPASARKTEVEYASTVGPTTPAGTYSTIFTYVATGNF